MNTITKVTYQWDNINLTGLFKAYRTNELNEYEEVDNCFENNAERLSVQEIKRQAKAHGKTDEELDDNYIMNYYAKLLASKRPNYKVSDDIIFEVLPNIEAPLPDKITRITYQFDETRGDGIFTAYVSKKGAPEEIVDFFGVQHERIHLADLCRQAIAHGVPMSKVDMQHYFNYYARLVHNRFHSPSLLRSNRFYDYKITNDIIFEVLPEITWEDQLNNPS